MKCLNCEREMVKSGVVANMRSKYCSNKCRQQFHRNANRNVTSVTVEGVTVNPDKQGTVTDCNGIARPIDYEGRRADWMRLESW